MTLGEAQEVFHLNLVWISLIRIVDCHYFAILLDKVQMD